MRACVKFSHSMGACFILPSVTVEETCVKKQGSASSRIITVLTDMSRKRCDTFQKDTWGETPDSSLFAALKGCAVGSDLMVLSASQPIVHPSSNAHPKMVLLPCQPTAPLKQRTPTHGAFSLPAYSSPQAMHTPIMAWPSAACTLTSCGPVR